MPTDIELFVISAGGVIEPKADWTEAASRHFKDALMQKKQALGSSAVELSAKQADEADEINALHGAIARAIAMHHFGALTLPTKDGKLDWSLGESVLPIKQATGADYALFSFVRDSYASDERKAAMVAMAILTLGERRSPCGIADRLRIARRPEHRPGRLVQSASARRPAICASPTRPPRPSRRYCGSFPSRNESAPVPRAEAVPGVRVSRPRSVCAQSQQWAAPARFARPDAASDEGGLWAMMDREESRLRRSPFALRDAQFQAYIQDIACRLGTEHCPDIRVHIMRTPLFNASMAPNGMMQVWTGLMLRVENEAQLAAVLGHEIGHYLSRHSVERLRDARSHSAAAQVLSLFGLVGALGQLGLAASMMTYSREHEREADRIGLLLMNKAGYATPEAAKVWQNLELELKERPDGGARNPLFSTHPAPEDRQQELAALAATFPGGVTNDAEWQKRVQPFLREWLIEEVKRGQHEETLALLTRLAKDIPSRPEYLVARAETYRLRGANDDLDKAIGDYKAALAIDGVPPEAYRGLGMIQRQRDQPAEARANLLRYIELAPQAPDAAMIKSYVEELKS